MVIPKLCLWSLENGCEKKWSPSTMSAMVPRAVLIPQDLRVKHGWSCLWLCWISPLCPCSEGNGFRGTNSLSVSWSGTEQIAGLKSPTTHCYKSIKHLQLTIEPPASAAEHVNSCDQITAQLTAFTCAPNVPISKGKTLAWLCPWAAAGDQDEQDRALWEAGRGTPQPYPGQGQRCVGKGSSDSGPSGGPVSSSPVTVTAVGAFPRIWSWWGWAMGLISWWLPWREQVCSGVLPLTAPPHLCQRKLLLFLYSEAADRFCSKRSNALGGEFSPAGPARQGLCEEPARKGPRGPRAGTPRPRRRRRGVFASAAAVSGPLAARQPPMFPLALVRTGIQENNRQRWGLSRSGGAGQRSPAWGPATVTSSLWDGLCSGDYFGIKITPHGGGAMGVKSVHEAGRRLPEMSAVPRKSYGRQTNKGRNTQISCRLHYLGHGSNKPEHRETWPVPPCTDTTTPIVKEPGRCWECPCTALGLPDTVRDPDCPCRSVCGPNRAQTGSDMFLVPGKFPVTGTDSQELTSPRWWHLGRSAHLESLPEKLGSWEVARAVL